MQGVGQAVAMTTPQCRHPDGYATAVDSARVGRRGAMTQTGEGGKFEDAELQMRRECFVFVGGGWCRLRLAVAPGDGSLSPGIV